MCIEVPKLTPPILGLGLSVEPPSLPAFSGDLEICCKQLPFNVVPPPIPLPPFVLNGAVSAFIASAAAEVNRFVGALPLDCPLE